jgi:hypothetical protein
VIKRFPATDCPPAYRHEFEDPTPVGGWINGVAALRRSGLCWGAPHECGGIQFSSRWLFQLPSRQSVKAANFLRRTETFVLSQAGFPGRL